MADYTQLPYKKPKSKHIKKAVAIKYESDDVAPKVLAKGSGLIADKILEKAEEEKIAVYEDKELVNILDKLDIGEYIPPELYSVVAKILVFVTDLDKMRDKF